MNHPISTELAVVVGRDQGKYSGYLPDTCMLVLHNN